MKICGYIYKTTCWLDGRIYSGQKQGYFNPNYLGSGIHLKRAVNKYGEENFSVEFIQYARNQKELDSLEKCCIATIKSIFPEEQVFNIAEGGLKGIILKGKNNPSYGKTSHRKGKTYEEYFGEEEGKRQRELRTGKNNYRYGKKIPHKENCLCMCCKSKRGETKGENGTNWRGGLCLQKNFCLDCNKEIGRGSKRCLSCAGSKHRKGCGCIACQSKRGERSGENHACYGMKKGPHKKECNCASCQMKRGEMTGRNNPNYGRKHTGKDCNCCVCRNIRGENTGEKNYGFGKPSPKRGKTWEELLGNKRAKELKRATSKRFKGKVRIHTENCKCMYCNAKRGGNSGKKNPMSAINRELRVQ